MKMTEAAPLIDFLDVGHGSSVVLQSSGESAIVDLGGTPEQIRDWLVVSGITEIEALVLTHLHSDHCIGVPAVLYEDSIIVKAIFANSRIFEDSEHDPGGGEPISRRLLDRLKESVNYWSSKTGKSVSKMTDGGSFTLGDDLTVTAIWPSSDYEDQFEGHDNRFSIVTRVESHQSPGFRALLTGDADSFAFRTITATRSPVSLMCDVLLFPHHGGRPGSADPSRFATLVARTASAETVVIQNGRKWPHHPHPSIVSGIREAPTTKKIVCTQLAHCCDDSVTLPSNDELLPACAGSVTVDWDYTVRTRRDDHEAFVKGVTSAKCLGR